MSLSVSSRAAAARIGSPWAGRRKPTIAASTAELRSVQATATAPGSGVVAVGDRLERGGQREVPAQLRLGESGIALAPVVVGHRRDPLPGDRPGQQPGA